MRVLSGRASCGARAVLRALFGGVFAVLGLIAGGCGNTTFTYGTPVISFSTTPGPFTAYLVEVDGLQLVRSDGTTLTVLLVPQVVDFTRLNDLSELFGTPALIEGTYTSATIVLNYGGAQIYANVNGTSKQVTVYDGNATTPNTAATTVTYVVKFDPAHPLVIKKGVSTPIDFNFDLSASSVLDTSASTPTLTVHPMITASTEPVYRKPLRSRGLYVATDTTNSNFTVNSLAFFDLTMTNPRGAVTIQTDANTTYNVNGVSYTGAAGLAAINTLPVDTSIESYGQLGDLNAVKPTFLATQVYAGISVQNRALTHVTGTVSARTGDTLTIHGAEVQYYSGLNPNTLVAVFFFDNLPVTVGDKTLVAVDGQPNLSSPTPGLISIGQQVDIEGTGTLDNNNVVTNVDATGGLVRLVPTALWGTVSSAQGTTLTSNVITLGGFQPEVLTYTGTGSATGADSNPGAYQINNASTTDLSTLPTNPPPLVRVDGMVAPFGGAQPDFIASAITPGSSTDQLLVVDWVNGGSAAPFTVASDGITVNMSDPNLGTSHAVQTGPPYINSQYTTIDLTNPVVNPKIIPDPQITGQFNIGNASSTAYSAFHSYSSFQTQVSTVLNGTNKIQKLVAVGKWDGANFTAYRIDIVQLP